jgi:transglutaminase-like putative cysteine protease
MALFNILHITKYQYNFPIKESINEIRLFPHNFENQEVIQHKLQITGSPEVEYSEDYYGNKVGNFNILGVLNEMTIESQMLVNVSHSMLIPEIDDALVSDLKQEIVQSILLFRLSSPESIKKQDQINAILNEINIENKTIIEIAQQCNHYIYSNFTYTKGITNIETTVDEILEIKQGVCQDFAHLLLQLLRTVGIPSRYVSGYICPNQSGMRGEGATHAWVEFYSPTQGWLGLDPTNDIWTMDNHVKLAVGRNFVDCTPIKGTFKGVAKQSLSVSVSIAYEDGTQFKDINDVKLQEISAELLEQIKSMEYVQQQ